MKINDIIGSFDDIYEYLGTPYLKTNIGKIHIFVIGFSFFIALSFMLVLIISKFFNRKKTPWEHASEQLSAASKKYKEDPYNIRELYFHLTEVVKYLVESRFKFKALSKTDSEFLHMLKLSNLDESLAQSLNDLFERAQSAKFASLNQAQDLVLQDITLIENAIKEWEKVATRK